MLPIPASLPAPSCLLPRTRARSLFLSFSLPLVSPSRALSVFVTDCTLLDHAFARIFMLWTTHFLSLPPPFCLPPLWLSISLPGASMHRYDPLAAPPLSSSSGPQSQGTGVRAQRAQQKVLRVSMHWL